MHLVVAGMETCDKELALVIPVSCATYIGRARKIEAIKTAEMVTSQGHNYDFSNEREMIGFIRREREYCYKGVISNRGRLVCG
jgi:hypothetical protein